MSHDQGQGYMFPGQAGPVYTQDDLLRMRQASDQEHWDSLGLSMSAPPRSHSSMSGSTLSVAVPLDVRDRMSRAYGSAPRLEMVLVPQTPFQGPNSQDPTAGRDEVYFNTDDNAFISLALALRGDVDRLVEKDAPALPRVSSKISIRIHFQHCGEPYHRQVMALRSTSSAESISRGKLAQTIAKETLAYLRQGAEIRINGRTFPLEDVYLWKLCRVSKGSWQPEFFVCL